VELDHDKLRFVPMAKTPTKIEVMQEGDERFLLMTFADGREERKPIVKLPRTPSRFPYRKVTSTRAGRRDIERPPEPVGKTHSDE